MTIVEPTPGRGPTSHASGLSPVESPRVRALAARALTGAPALTPGEVRELADAVSEHNRHLPASVGPRH